MPELVESRSVDHLRPPVARCGRVTALPPYSGGLTFSDARHGFAFPDFSNGISLSFTEDGGRNWTQVPVPRGDP